MKATIKKMVLGILCIMVLSSFNTEYDVVNWDRIGSKKVNYRIDRDVMLVGSHKGQFKKLKLRVTGGDLNMHKMIIHYNNGTLDEIKLRQTFNKQSKSRVIDLKGKNRFIKKIVFIYDTQNNARRRARLTVLGKR